MLHHTSRGTCMGSPPSLPHQRGIRSSKAVSILFHLSEYVIAHHTTSQPTLPLTHRDDLRRERYAKKVEVKVAAKAAKQETKKRPKEKKPGATPRPSGADDAARALKVVLPRPLVTHYTPFHSTDGLSLASSFGLLAMAWSLALAVSIRPRPTTKPANRHHSRSQGWNSQGPGFHDVLLGPSTSLDMYRPPSHTSFTHFAPHRNSPPPASSPGARTAGKGQRSTRSPGMTIGATHIRCLL